MHFEILVEDLSGKRALDVLMPKILGDQHTFRVIDYRGVGRIPKNLKSSTDAGERILLDQLPRLLRGYGRTFAGYRPNYRATGSGQREIRMGRGHRATYGCRCQRIAQFPVFSRQDSRDRLMPDVSCYVSSRWG